MFKQELKVIMKAFLVGCLVGIIMLLTGCGSMNRTLNGAGQCKMPITGEVDPVCQQLVSQGKRAVPAPKRNWSAPDRCEYFDSWPDNTDFYCVPKSARTQPTEPQYTGQTGTQFATTTIATQNGIYTYRSQTTGPSTQGQFYRYGGKR